MLKQSKKELFFEIIRFLIVGGLATIVDYIIFYLCNLVFFKQLDSNLNTFLSTALGFVAGLFTNWFLQKFVYRYISKEQQKSKFVFFKFVILSLIGLGLTELVMMISQPLFDDLTLTIFNISFQFWKLFFKVLMTLIVLIINYIGRKLFVFNQKNKDDKENE